MASIHYSSKVQTLSAVKVQGMNTATICNTPGRRGGISTFNVTPNREQVTCTKCIKQLAANDSKRAAAKPAATGHTITCELHGCKH